MFDNIFATTYKYYSKFKTEAPRFSAVCVLTICQILLAFLFLILLRKLTGFDFFGMLPSKFYFLPVFFIWLFVVYRYYNKEKIEEFLERFEHKPLNKRKLWAATALTMFILPVILIAILLRK